MSWHVHTADKQTDRQTDRHTHHNTSHPTAERSNKLWRVTACGVLSEVVELASTDSSVTFAVTNQTSVVGQTRSSQSSTRNCTTTVPSRRMHKLHWFDLSYNSRTTNPRLVVRRKSYLCHNSSMRSAVSIEHYGLVTDRQTDRHTNHMARCVTFAVARMRAYFSLWHRKYGRQRIQKGLHWSEDRYIPADQIWL